MAADQHGQEQREGKQGQRQPHRELLQHVGGLSSPDLAGGGVAEGGAKAFLPRALHEHDENEQKADDDFDCGEDANEDVHKRGREYGGTSGLGKGQFWPKTLPGPPTRSSSLAGRPPSFSIIGMKSGVLFVLLALCPAVRAADPFFPPAAAVERLFTAQGETEGCTTAPDGAVYFSDITLSRIVRDAQGVMQGGHIWRFDPKTGKTTLFRSPSAKSNGLEFDPTGRLVACEGADFGGRRISRTDMQTGLCSILTATFDGHPYNAPNDLAIARDGSIFFTDPKYVGPEPLEQPVMAVYRIDPQNKVIRLITDAGKPNGICLSPDEKTLYVGVNDNGSSGVDSLLNAKHEPPPLRKGLMAILAYDLKTDCTAAFRNIVVDFGSDPGPDGIVCDAQGNVWAAARNPARPGVVVYSPEGKELAYLKAEPPPTNLCFGKGDDRHLYLTSGSSLCRVPLK